MTTPGSTRHAALGGGEVLVARSDDASGLDAAVAAASGRYLAFVHVNDTVADPGLQRLVETAEQQRADVVLGTRSTWSATAAAASATSASPRTSHPPASCSGSTTGARWRPR